MGTSQLASLFHAQSYQDAWAEYVRVLNGRSAACWDYVILTASNEQQARSFDKQLDERRNAGFLPEKTHFAVVADPDGRRVGSGGATLNVIHYIAQREGAASFDGLRILVIHSGGDSRRVPQYSALGKLFSPVPHMLPNGRASTLFDEMMVMMASVPSRIREGMLLASGDVMMLFNPLQIDFAGEGAAAISFKEPASLGCRHGVYLRGTSGFVARCLQKKPVEELQAAGAVNEQGHVDIDTGAVIFSCAMMRALYALICKDGAFSQDRFDRLISERVRLSLYADFLYPLGEEATLERFLLEKPEGEDTPELRAAREEVWRALSPYRMKLLRLAPARFIHFGTTAEIMQLMSSEIERYESLGWSRNVCSSNTCSTASAYASVLNSHATCGRDVYLEVSNVQRDAVIGDRVLLSHVDVHDEIIPSDVVLHGLKQTDGRFVVRIYGVLDNPKEQLEEGCHFMGGTLSGFMAENGIDADELWETDDHSLWNARLYPVCSNIREGVAAALNVWRMTRGQGDVAQWREAERRSLCAGFNEADPDALIAWNQRMQQLVAIEQICNRMEAGVPVSIVAADTDVRHLTRIQREWLDAYLSQADFSSRIRIHYYLGRVIGGPEGEKHVAEAFRLIREGILEGARAQLVQNTDCRIRYESWCVQLPLRVNWGGGWSDTPPYCNECGGTVLNAAILLDGRMPVEVTLERTERLAVVFDSRDMDSHGEFTDIRQLQTVGDPYDPFVLQKAALLACGVIPASGGSLQETLQRLGGGFVMHTEVTGVPKGSGLGTSSILAAACVKALSGFLGLEYPKEELYSRVLVMEQIMSTGGGWQDQVGGLCPGVKMISSLPGMKQELRVETLRIPESAMQELQERFCLICTGQRRLARNLLRDVVGRYIGCEPDTLHALNEIQRVAALMRFELERGHVDDFAALLNEHWKLSRMVDRGSSNTLIDQIFLAVDDLIDGRMICGAGGGGFLQVVLKKGITRDMLKQRIQSVFQDSDVDVWACSIV